MCKYSSDKDLAKLVRKLIGQGWTYERRRKHGCLLHPGGRIKVTVPGSTSDRKALQNFKGDIKRLIG